MLMKKFEANKETLRVAGLPQTRERLVWDAPGEHQMMRDLPVESEQS